MSAAEVSLDTFHLEAINAALEQGKGMYLKVGVLGDYAGRTPDESGTKRKDSKMTNPLLGLIHEFGSIKRNIPERSFLRMPILLKLPDALKDVDWVPALLTDGVFGVLDMIGNKCVEIISGAFATDGFGQWQAWSYRYAKLRERMQRAVLRGKNKFIGPVKPGHILVLSGQLQRSVTYAVVKNGDANTQIFSA